MTIMCTENWYVVCNFLLPDDRATVTTEVYHDLAQLFIALLDERWYGFQQDGATSHTVNKTYCKSFSVIICFQTNLCPLRFMDLTLLDFYLWGHIKVLCLQTNLIHLKTNIETIEALLHTCEETLQKVLQMS